ncbi:beta-glucosidase [Mesorhizobium sp. M0166]|uniref:glucoamylase family protein n=1 Tax=Mesorhizobium sp. M0166 TaxID=2956902 RepID=UPI0033375B77
MQRQTARYFWEGAHPVSGLARDRQKTTGAPANDLAAIGGSGFGIMAIIVAVERGWIDSTAALCRLQRMLDFLESSPRYHGVFPHFINGRTGATIPFRRKDDGADLVETTFLFQGLICAREYFAGMATEEARLRHSVNALLSQAEWNWFARGARQLMWHWSPNHGWAMDSPIRGWNECMLTFVLAAGSTRHSIDPGIYHEGFAGGSDFRNGRDHYGIVLPLGMDSGGPLFFSQYSFCGLDPRGLSDRYADYWQQNLRHTQINYWHCVRNPHSHLGYGPDCWGLTASHGPRGYVAHAPDRDFGVITPSAALSSFPYAPAEAMRALRGFLTKPRKRIWGRFGFVDAFCESRNWYSRTYLAINQGPIIAMIENHRTGLLRRLFMRAPEVRRGLARLSFTSQHLDTSTSAQGPRAAVGMAPLDCT